MVTGKKGCVTCQLVVEEGEGCALGWEADEVGSLAE